MQNFWSKTGYKKIDTKNFWYKKCCDTKNDEHEKRNAINFKTDTKSEEAKILEGNEPKAV